MKGEAAVSDVRLLNPQEDLKGAKELLVHAQEVLQRHEAKLSSILLDRETYLTTMGAAQALRDLCAGLQRKYEGMIHK